MQLSREVPFFEWKNADQVKKVEIPFFTGSLYPCYRIKSNKDAGVFHFNGVFPNNNTFLIIAWKYEKNQLTIQEHWKYSETSQKTEFIFPCDVAKGGVFMYKQETSYILNVVTQDDYLYQLKGTICQSNANSYSLQFDISSIQRIHIDEDEYNLQSCHVRKFIWNEHFLCRLIDSSYVLYTEFISPTSLQTIRLYNNQFSITRVLQTFLHTSSQILDIDYYDNTIWFLYNTYEIQCYSTLSHKWEHFIPFQLPTIINPNDRLYSGFIRVATNAMLLVLQTQEKEKYQFYLLPLQDNASLISIQDVTPFSIVSEYNPSFSHIKAKDEEAIISSLLFTANDLDNTYKVYFVWEKQPYSWLSLCSIDTTTFQSVHQFATTLADDLGCFIENANYLTSSSLPDIDFTSEMKEKMNEHYSCLLLHQYHFSFALLGDLLPSSSSQASLHHQLVHYIEIDYEEKQKKQQQQNSGSNLLSYQLYNDCWLGLLKKILAYSAPLYSISLINDDILLSRWYSLSTLQYACIFEQYEYTDFSSSILQDITVASNHVYNQFHTAYPDADKLPLVWQDNQDEIIQLLQSFHSTSFNEIQLFEAFQTICSQVLSSYQLSPTSMTCLLKPSSIYSTSFFLAQFDRYCYSLYYRLLPYYYFLLPLSSMYPSLQSFYQQILRLLICSYSYLQVFRIHTQQDNEIHGLLEEYYIQYEKAHRKDQEEKDAINWMSCFDYEFFSLEATDFVSFLFEHEYYSAIVDYLCPLLLHEDQFNLTESEKKVLQEKEHILIRSCFYAKKTEYLEEIHPLLQQYTSQEDSLLFLLRTAYEVDQHSYFSDYSTIALSSFPSSRNIVLSLNYKHYLERNEIDKAIHTLLEMPTEQATLHLPSFISSLCKTNHIECLKEYDFKDLTVNLHQALLTECNSNPSDSPINTTAYYLFEHSGDPELSVLPLVISLSKLSYSSQTSIEDIKTTLQEKQQILGLLIAKVNTFPPDRQWVYKEGVSRMTLHDLQKQLLFIEGQSIILEKEEIIVDNLNVLLNKLLQYQQIQLVIQFYDVYQLHDDLLYYYLSKQWYTEMTGKGISGSFYHTCKEIFEDDRNGYKIASFMNCLLEEDSCTVIPPLLFEIVLNHVKEGYSSYIPLCDCLLKHHVIDETCRLIYAVLVTLENTNSTTWISENCIDRLVNLIDSLTTNEDMDKNFVNSLNCWKEKILLLLANHDQDL